MADEKIVDARRLLCPMPVIRLQQTIARLAPGDEVDLLSTDPGSRRDVPAWCRVHGHELLSCEEREDGVIVTRVRVTDR